MGLTYTGLIGHKALNTFPYVVVKAPNGAYCMGPLVQGARTPGFRATPELDLADYRQYHWLHHIGKEDSMKKASRKAAMKNRVVPRGKQAHRQETKAVPKDMEDGVSCPDCREPMTQVLTVTTFKWECRCSPGIHYSE